MAFRTRFCFLAPREITRASLRRGPYLTGTVEEAAASSLRTPRRLFHSQHRTPRIPQRFTTDPLPSSSSSSGSCGEANDATAAPLLHVGYVLARHPVVKPVPHPMERAYAFLLERYHQMYSRHRDSESALHFFRDRQQTIDAHQRTDPQDIRRDFYGLEAYRDALHATLQRYEQPPSRLQPGDFVETAPHRAPPPSPSSAPPGGGSPPRRHTLQRKLDDYLFLIVRYTEGDGVAEGAVKEGTGHDGPPRLPPGFGGKWGVPYTPLRQGETLRIAAERCIQLPHQDRIDYYLWSCAPQGTVPLPTAQDQGVTASQLFLFNACYLAGRPDFAAMQPRIDDHAWVTRGEMRQYRDSFASTELLELLLDVTPDAYFETP